MKIKIIAVLTAVLFLCGCSCNPGGVTSDSDVNQGENITEQWNVSKDDTEYLAAMKTRVAWIFDAMVELDERQSEFAEYGRADRLENSREYSEIRKNIQGWCKAALEYPQNSLRSDLAKNTHAKTVAFAELLLDYIDVYPQIAVGEISGDDEKNAVVDAAVELYMLLWG